MMISVATPFNLLNQDLLLLPQKAIYWQQQKALIVADVHFGKVGHFRKAGIAVPPPPATASTSRCRRPPGLCAHMQITVLF